MEGIEVGSLCAQHDGHELCYLLEGSICDCSFRFETVVVIAELASPAFVSQ